MKKWMLGISILLLLENSPVKAESVKVYCPTQKELKPEWSSKVRPFLEITEFVPMDKKGYKNSAAEVILRVVQDWTLQGMSFDIAKGRALCHYPKGNVVAFELTENFLTQYGAKRSCELTGGTMMKDASNTSRNHCDGTGCHLVCFPTQS